MEDKTVDLQIGEYIKLGKDLVFVDSVGDLHYRVGGGRDMWRYSSVRVVPVLEGLLEYLDVESLDGIKSKGLKEVNFTNMGVLVLADKGSYVRGGDFLNDLEQTLDEEIGFDKATEWLGKGVWVAFV